jgi:hypothetical protein
MRPVLLVLIAFSVAGTSACDRNRTNQQTKDADRQPGAPPPAASAETSGPSTASPPPGEPVDGSVQAPPSSTGSSAAAPQADDAADRSRGHTTPRYREVRVPAGTTLHARLETGVASDTSRVEEPVRARLSRPLIAAGATVLPTGTELRGSVIDVRRAGKVKGRARVALRFDTVDAGDERTTVSTATIVREAHATKAKDAKKIGIPAAGGAIVGGLLGGGKGAAIGATVGGGAGTAVVLSTRGEDVRLPPGTPVTITLREAFTIRVPIDQ